MRNLNWLLLLFLLFSSNVYGQTNYKVGLIGFYNLENLFDTIDGPNNDAEFLPDGANRYTGKIYLDKLEKLSSVLSMIGTDISPDGLSIIGTAEIENESVLKDLVKMPSLKERNYEIVHFESPDLRGIDVALLYNPRYFKVTHKESLFISLPTENGSPWLTRDILYVSGIYDGEPLHLFVNHWPSRRGGETASAPGRAAAAAVAKTKIDSINNVQPDAKIILMGDLNDDPLSPSVTKVLGATSDTSSIKGNGMYNPWVTMYKAGIGTLAYNDAWNLFDQIIISKAFLRKKQDGFFFQKAMIFQKEFMKQQSGRYRGYPLRTYEFSVYNGGYSDHFPTYIQLLKQDKTVSK